MRSRTDTLFVERQPLSGCFYPLALSAIRRVRQSLVWQIFAPGSTSRVDLLNQFVDGVLPIVFWFLLHLLVLIGSFIYLHGMSPIEPLWLLLMLCPWRSTGCFSTGVAKFGSKSALCGIGIMSSIACSEAFSSGRIRCHTSTISSSERGLAAVTMDA